MLRSARSGAAARLLVSLATGAILLTMALLAPPRVIALSLVEKVALMLPGVLLVRAIAGPSVGWLPAATFGPLLGVALSSLPLLGIWMAGGRGSWTLFVSPALLLMLLPFARRLKGRWQLPGVMPGDRAALAAVILVVPLVVAVPFAHVGKILPEGKAYRAYFTADYAWLAPFGLVVRNQQRQRRPRVRSAKRHPVRLSRSTGTPRSRFTG